MLTIISRTPFAKTLTKEYASSTTVGISTYAKSVRNLVTMPWLAAARKEDTREALTTSKGMVMVKTTGTGITTKTGVITSSVILTSGESFWNPN